MEDSMFNNSSYQLDRLDRQTIILDIVKGNEAGVDKINFSVELMEALNIDKKYNLFLDSITTHNCVQNNSTNTMGFLLSINNFNILSSSSQEISRKLFIPNEQSGSGTDVTKTHKGKKMNYICKVEPTRIQTINGSITLLDGSNDIFDGTNGGRIIIELILIKAE